MVGADIRLLRCLCERDARVFESEVRDTAAEERATEPAPVYSTEVYSRGVLYNMQGLPPHWGSLGG